MITLYLDEDVPVELARQLKRRGIDVATAQEAGMLGRSDHEQLEYATAAGRVLLTYDNDFIGLARRWFEEGRHHSGIVISRAYRFRELGTLVRLCSRLVTQASDEEMLDATYILEQYR